ncbi:MAG: Hsp70 family protein [Propionicimonas sp.]|uniref:Hsp70 family protein n=1 Tax=Propionicimonas sp. TaxID=1955623 RepID=UPI003D13487C
MKLGVDFGTTRTIVAVADRGNYPVVAFEDASGDLHEFFPSVVALRGTTLLYGFDALAAAREGAPSLRSVKRLLGAPEVAADTPVGIGGATFGLLDVLTGFLGALRAALGDASNIGAEFRAAGECPTVVSVPAHAHGAQRFLTLEAFRRAGFEVAGLVNEPSAAGFEYTHRQGRTLNSKRNQVLVYDLGGGTFDASLVEVAGVRHDVIGSVGVNRLGGDDFDQVLAELALDAAGRPALDEVGRQRVRDECREAKERLTPQAKRITVEVAGEPVTVAVEDFYAAASGLVNASLEAMAPLVGALDDEVETIGGQVAGIYLVGGGSGLPLVPRLLRERFGRRVHRSPYPAASTAIGLAIAADPASGYALTDRLWRGFGVFRERAGGRGVRLDQLVDRNTALPTHGELSVTRRYRAAHNVGWYRFVEYADLTPDGEPRGDLAPFAEVRFPFDPALQGRYVLDAVPVERWDHGPLVEESYRVDPNGIVSVRISDLDTGYSQVYGLGRGE